MHIIQNYTLKKNVVKNFLPLVMALLQGTKNLFKLPTPRLANTGSRRLPDSPMRGVVDSPTHRYGESIFDYEYLHEFEAKIETARKLVCGTMLTIMRKFGSLPCPLN